MRASGALGAFEIRSDDYAISYDEDEDPTADPEDLEWTIERPNEED